MKTIGKYQVVERIGVGGFGEVYKAYDPFIKRHVAVKTCSSDDQEIRDRFFKEAEIAGNLHHRNVTTVYDFGVQDELPYLVQEYLSGEDLDHKIKRRDFLPFPEKLYYLLQIARGLAYAHSKGVIHRDVKPANIRILEDGTAKIMDFGIAKLAQQETGLTQTGMTLGTAAYLAPEQIRGDTVDHRTDVFSFGVLAYELLTYERPFQGEQISAVLYQILNQDPKPIRVDETGGIPPEIVGLINRCLSKVPGRRYANGDELLKELEQVQKRGRAERQLPADGAAPSAATPTAPVRPISPSRPVGVQALGVPPRSRAPSGSLDEVELTSVRQDMKRSRSMPVRRPGARRSSPLRRVGLLVVLAAVAMAVGLGIGTLTDRTSDQPTAPAAADETAGPESGEVTDVGAGPDASPAPPEQTPPAAAEAGTEPSTAEPPPPPEPQPGYLVVPGVDWTEMMTVRVGGRTYRLTRQRRIELKPGSYSATFKVEQADYEATETVQVRIGEGQSHTLPVPIAEPGTLSVRARLGTPQGRVTVGERALGQSPLANVKIAPDDYLIRIQPLSGEGSGVDDRVIIASGQETIVTFDLGAGEMAIRFKSATAPGGSDS